LIFRTHRAAVVAPKGRKTSSKHYQTYAFRTERDEEIQEIVRNVMDRIRETDEPDTEVQIPQAMNESRVRSAIQDEWDESNHAGGTVSTESNEGGDQVFSFDDGNEDEELDDEADESDSLLL
jgi:hypothetical protein